MSKKNSLNIIIVNQQKNKNWLNKLISIIKIDNIKNKIKILKKVSLKSVKNSNCDLLVSFHNGQIITKDIINHLNRRCINFHNSALPKNRGWAPILWTAYNNDLFATTIHEISSGLDTGNIYGQKLIKKSLKNYTMEQVYNLLEKESLNLFKKIFPKIKKEVFSKKKVINYKKQIVKKGSYQNELQSKILMGLLPRGYKTKIKDITALGKNKSIIIES